MRSIFSSGRYSVVASTLALVVAASGTSYAAVMVTGNQIQDGTVTTADVKDQSLRLRDLSGSARDGLQGPAGPQGPAGEPGERGEQGEVGPSDAVVLERDGGPVTSSPATFASTTLGPGSYVIEAKVAADRTGSSPVGGWYSCDLAAGGDVDTAHVSMSAYDIWATTSNYLAVESGTDVQVSLKCTGASANLFEIKLFAVKVGTITRR